MIAKLVPNVRYEPLYTAADVGRYAHVNPETLRAWTGGRGRTALIRRAGSGVAPFSFMNLIEAHMLVALRKTHRISMPRIRRAVRWLGQHFETSHPLAEVNLETDGRDLFVEHLGLTVSASESGQIAIPKIIHLYLHRVVRDTSGPVRFYPFTSYYKDCPRTIMMDPCVDFGRPVIDGTRIETIMIADRFDGGESLKTIAEDYDIPFEHAEEAVRCEKERRAA